jgi:hypothetical protein
LAAAAVLDDFDELPHAATVRLAVTASASGAARRHWRRRGWTDMNLLLLMWSRRDLLQSRAATEARPPGPGSEGGLSDALTPAIALHVGMRGPGFVTAP